MLRELLTLIEANDGCLSVGELSRRLHAEPSAVEGMVQTLLARGRLLSLDGAGSPPCESCGASEGCALAAFRNKRYVVAPRN
jgi:hypothetical protein